MENLTEENIKKDFEDIYANVLYVADLPKETTAEDLKILFKDYHFQFASLNNYKNNKTWAQVYLENKDWANQARHELNGYSLKPLNCDKNTKGKPIRICKYEGKGANKQTNIKQSLLVKNIDINMTQKEFYDIFLEYGDIVSGKIEYDENGISKGFGYIYYYTEESAEEAKKNLNGKSFFGKNIEIVNLIPGKKNKNNNITLFVLNIPNDITEEKLNSIFEKFGPVSNISINPRGFAYVSYNNFDSASKCLNQMKINPISFSGLPNVVVKFASTKEERESHKNFDKNDYVQSNLNIQFNSLYYNAEIKNDLDLDKEIRLFIKVVMLMDYSPKDVLVDFESMSGIAIFDKYQDYNLFFKKYHEFCQKQMPIFECLPYEMPIMNNEEMNNYYEQENQNQKNYPINNSQIPFNQETNNFRINNNMLRRNNTTPNMSNIGIPGPYNMFMNPNNYNNMNNNKMMMNNNGINMNNFMKRNNKYIWNKNNFNNFNNNNNNFGDISNNNNKKFINNHNKKNYKNNNQNQNNNKKTIIQRPNLANNNNQKFIFRQNYGNSYNININMNQNMMPLNPFIQQQMFNNQNNPKFYNGFNNIRKPLNPMNFQNNNFMGLNQNNNDIDNNNYLSGKQKSDKELIDERNLQNLNPSQLQSQFNNKPPIDLYGPHLLNSKEQEDLINEIADSIYEIVYAKYPNEASKITGMIREKGYEKMNMLLSKKEDLYEIIDKAYEMINNSKNKNNKADNSDSKLNKKGNYMKILI